MTAKRASESRNAEGARPPRIARARRWLARSGWLLLILVLCSAVLLYWLLATLRGRDALLAQIVARLPAGSELTWSRAEGPASGPLVLHDVRFVHRACPDRNGATVAWPRCEAALVTVFTAKRAMLDPALRPLLDRRLRLDDLRIADARLELPQDDAPFELPRWPESLPRIAPPLALQADAIAIDGLHIARADTALIEIRKLRGGIDAGSGRLHLQRIVADTDRGRWSLHGDYAPGEDYRMDLTAAVVAEATASHPSMRLGLVARGDLHALDIALAGAAPSPLLARLRLRQDDQAGARPRWRFDADSEGFALDALLGADEAAPYRFDLRAEGVGGAAALQGRIARGDLALTLRPSKLVLEQQVLTLAPLSAEWRKGVVEANGRVDFGDPRDPVFDGVVRLRGLRLRGEGARAATVVGEGDFEVKGRWRAWTARGAATLTRDGERAKLELAVEGDAEAARIRRVRATMPSGALEGEGRIAWMPTLQWQADARLAGFDPGYVLPDWNGAVNGRLHSAGTRRADGAIDAVIDARDLGGRLRARALQGRVSARLRVPARDGGRIDGEGEIALRLGESRIDAKGRIAERMAIDAELSPLRLNDVLPKGEGVLRGHLRLNGSRTQPDIDVDLRGEALRYEDWRAQRLHARGQLPWRGGEGGLRIEAESADVGLILDRVRVDARGALESLRIEADAQSELGDFALSARGGAQRGKGQSESIQLDIAAFEFTPRIGPAWRLQSPARLRQDGARWRWASSCFVTANAGDGRLCAEADWPGRFDLRGRQVPMALLAPYLPARADDGAWRLQGIADVDAQIRPRGASWEGEAHLRSAAGALALEGRGRRELFGYADLHADARFDPQRIDAHLRAGLSQVTPSPDGRIAAHIATGWDAQAALSGEIDIDTGALTWMELFSPDIVEPQGRLEGRIVLAGTRARPTVGGQAHLRGFRAELPALALSLREGDLRMQTQADGDARIVGSLRSGEGVLRVDGAFGWRSDDTPLRLNLRGENVLISDTRELHAVVDPDVTVRYAVGQPIAVSGRLKVPIAKLDLERLDAGVSASSDVVVIDPANPERDDDAPLDLDLALVMGEQVKLKGFGLDGGLSGDLRARSRPGRETIATGALEIDGRYTAYGQKLRITRGRLLWSGTPFADPLLDIRAERQVGAVTAGIDVKGRASAPEAQVWSEPATSESEALAYLALGRPLASANADESRKLSAATAALSAGNLLASQLGAKIGLDDAGVSESRALGGTVVGIGKYISPRLYVGYGVSLLGTGQVLTLKYLLRKGFDIEIESSTVENRGSVNWRKEK
ncbi:MAG: translocation/assembly module TamB [Lysobacteraceae bacterium]|nr:MAG: translocation/assembly module TamB [Xanthomonadaceae bacterium]